MCCIKSMLLTMGLFAAIPLGLFAQDSGNPAQEHQEKIQWEISLGISGINPESISQRTSGIDTLIQQYAGYYQLNSSTNGAYSKIKRVIPFNLSANYGLKGKWSSWYLKAGIDYATGSISSGKTYQLSWTGFNETHEYHIIDKISYLLPHLGVGYRFSFLDFYGAVGLAFARFTYTEDFNYSEPGYGYETNHTFKVSGKAPAFIAGIKYRIKLNKNPRKNLHVFVKLESLLLKVNSWKGSKTTAGNNGGPVNPQTTKGTLYTFSWNPYGGQPFSFWDLYEAPPTALDLEMQNFKPLRLQFSGIRLMIGISF